MPALHRRSNLLLLSCIALALGPPGCRATPETGPAPPTVPAGQTAHREARAHLDRGWSLIMDEGRWTDAEAAFRAAMDADPDGVLGRALVGRITQDAGERADLLAWIESRLDLAPADERLMLDLYVMNLRAADARDRGVALDPGFGVRRTAIAITHSRAFLELHPGDHAVSAELVEWIHNRDGAEAALAAMDTEIDPAARTTPFMVKYRGLLLTELGRLDEAEAAARTYARMLDDPMAPGPHALWAAILHAGGRHEEARARIATAVQLDPANLSALGLQRTIDELDDAGTP